MKLFEGKVYMITSKETEKIYIGSTVMTLDARFKRHKTNLKRGTCSSKELLKYPDCDIYLLDRLFVTKSKNDPELLKLEGNYQKINKDICVNKCISRGLTQKEHDTRRTTDPILNEKIRKHRTIYYDTHREYLRGADRFRISFFGHLCKMYKIYN